MMKRIQMCVSLPSEHLYPLKYSLSCFSRAIINPLQFFSTLRPQEIAFQENPRHILEVSLQ